MRPHDSIALRMLEQRQSTNHQKLPIFYRNLEEALNVYRADNSLFPIVKSSWHTDRSIIDFASNDILSLGASGMLRIELLAELNRHPLFNPGSGGSRLLDGNYSYLEDAEQRIAKFHGAETGLLVGSGFEANVNIWTAIPRPGDVILFDALVHASTHEGMAGSLATHRREFIHNDVADFRQTLLTIQKEYPLIQSGKRSVLIAVESIYSMYGDVCPLLELVEIAQELFPEGNAQFIIDEAHSTGLIGPNGAGLVSALGLMDDIAIRVHTFGKALSTSGAIILGHHAVRKMLSNCARSIKFSTAPSFVSVAAIQAGYNLLASGAVDDAQSRVQHLVRHFFSQITSHPLWQQATAAGLLSVPLSADWDEKEFLSHIITIRTRQPYVFWLYFHLDKAKYSVLPVDYPVVPKGQSRIKLSIHANHDEADITGLINALYDWVQEMIALEEKPTSEMQASKAASEVYAWMATEQLADWGSR